MNTDTFGDDAPSFDLDPEDFRRLGHQVVELMVKVLEAERRDPVLAPISGRDARALFDEPVPRIGAAPEDLFARCGAELLDHCRHNGHPRFFSYVSASVDPLGALADALASLLNQNVTAWRSSPVAAEMERLVVRWLAEMVGFGGEHGLLVGGGSAANAIGLTCAVERAVARAEGTRGRLTIYLSRQAHLSLPKAARLLGLAEEQLRYVEVDAGRRLQLDHLAERLSADRAAGWLPTCVCASAGTANTGAIDPLEGIADLCEKEGIWFHVDGAYGAPAAMTEGYRWMRRAFARADSMSLDPHKWLFAPLDVGCALVRRPEDTRHAFALDSEYVTVTQTDEIERFAFFEHGPELSRRFRALKVWMILKVRGTDALAATIERNIQLCRYLDRHVAEEARLESLGTDLSISCFRYLPQSGDPDAVNRHILETLVAEGQFHLSPTTLEGRYSLRVCIVNFRTRREDLDLLVGEVLRLGREFEARG